MTAGPASALLEQELAQEVRRQGIVVWLDRDASFTTFTDGLAARHAAGGFPYPVVGFKGSFLELLFALETHGSGYEKNALLIHMPGFNEDQIRETPMLELYTAGTRFRKALDTLIRQAATGRVAPDQVDHFVAGKPTLEQADTWLAEAVARPAGGLAVLLEASGPTLVVEALATTDSTLARQVTSEADAAVLKTYLHNLTGIDGDWFDFARVDKGRPPLERVLYALGAWLLCVEYVHDLKRDAHLPSLRRLKALSPSLVKASARLIGELRDQHGEVYAQRADEVEALVHDELVDMTPDDLGHIDTFREEENRVLGGAVEALKASDWAKARTWCEIREGAKSFWINRDGVRRRAWDLVAEAARFGTVLAAHPRPFEKVTSHEEAVTRYAEGAFRVDRAHRRFEQERARRLDPQLPHFGALQEVVGILRQLHRTWADELSRAYARVCRNTGFLPPSALRQRSLYEQVVLPMAQGGEKVAVFLVDAFRYEMATELLEEMRTAGGGTVVDLKPRLAELPTITSVGMNALAPVAQGDKLTVAGAGDVFKGFRAGEYTVNAPAGRSRAMGMRTSGKPGLLIDLADLCDRTPETLKKLKDHPVVVVHSTEIDDAGEANLGVHSFEATLRQLRAAWHHLQGAGIKHAVFTADHGFLLQDETTATRPFDTKRTPQRRYVIDPSERGEAGMSPVAFSALGYEGISGFLLLLDDTAVFATGVAGATFVHGGNSPQERIIPVLTVSRKRVEASGHAEYAVEAEGQSDAFGFHRLRLRITFPRDAQTGLAFVGPRSIALDLRVPGRADVRAIVKEVSGAGSLKAGRIEAPVKEDWTDVFFALEGLTDERAPVELYHGDGIEKVRPCTVEKLFDVTGTQARGAVAAAVGGGSGWAVAIEDQAVRGIFLHIEKHRSITEAEIITMLGSPRAARRFALTFDDNLTKLPFKVRSDANASGKRYTREEDK